MAPLKIIQTWKNNEIPDFCYYLIMKMRSHNPNETFLFFTDNDILSFMNSFGIEYYETFKNMKYKIQQIDFFRYLVIYHYGGLYLDLDMDINSCLDSLDKTKCYFPIEIKEKDNTLIGNYAFYAPPRHPFLKHIIDCIMNPIPEKEIENAQDNHSDPREHVYVYFTTGPELVTRAYWSYPNREEIILLEPTGEFKKDCFGDYGKHCSYGSWKSVSGNLLFP
jgi:mannosyltransferase OCH1-like enzyme